MCSFSPATMLDKNALYRTALLSKRKKPMDFSLIKAPQKSVPLFFFVVFLFP